MLAWWESSDEHWLSNHSLQNLEHDIRTLQTNMDNLIETGEQLMKESTPSFSGYLEEELREIKENWEDIKVLAKKQEMAVQDAQEKTNKYHTETKEFAECLDEMAKDFGIETPVDSEDEIETQLKRVQVGLQHHCIGHEVSCDILWSLCEYHFLQWFSRGELNHLLLTIGIK